MVPRLLPARQACEQPRPSKALPDIRMLAQDSVRRFALLIMRVRRKHRRLRAQPSGRTRERTLTKVA